MNVAVFNLKEIIKVAIRLIVIIISLIAFLLLITKKINISENVFNLSLNIGLNGSLKYANTDNKKEKESFIDGEKIVLKTAKVLDVSNVSNVVSEKVKEVEENIKEIIEPVVLSSIPKIADTEPVLENNLKESFTNTYQNIKIKNQSNIEITEDMLTPDVEITNKKDILIFHTHTCESYTPSTEFPYTMMGNFRTTDENYNMVRVGEELSNHLTEKGFTVVHDKTMHDYPSYTGSYDRSYQTVQTLLYGKNTELVIDLHRDAVGDGLSYGPKVKINGENVAQLMFVIGTNGSGLNHPNWVQNLKIAVKIQTKANEMYPRFI